MKNKRIAMAEKKTTKKPTAKKTAKKTPSVDMATQVAPAETGELKLTEKMEMLEEAVPADEGLVNPSTDAITQAPDDAELVFKNLEEIPPKKSVVESEECETVVTDNQDAEVCSPEPNQETEIPEPEADEEMVNDITNILSGLGAAPRRTVTTPPAKEKSLANEEKPRFSDKEYYSNRFGGSWNGVTYDY